MDKTFPRLKTDAEIEALLEEDLSDYLTPDNFKLVTFEFKPKDKSVNIRMSEEMLEKVKSVSQKEGIPYQRYIRRAIERQFLNKIILHLNLIMVIPELEKQLLQLSTNDKLYIIQLLTQSLTTPETEPEQPSKLSEFFRQSPLVGIAEELDFSRDRSLPRDIFTP